MKVIVPPGTRDEEARELAVQLAGCYAEGEGEAYPSPIRGGRTEGLRVLRGFSVVGYAARRN
ncbi:MAG: hypothetical protein SNJ84_10580, partial [Verrucomicrobiia bacterium]